MLRPRIIPFLMIHKNQLYKTYKFSNPKYVGDPLNAVKIFNEKEVDELIIADIDASVLNKEPNYKLIEKLANECRMPFCYSGGIKSINQAKKILGLGVEKIGISSEILKNPELIYSICSEIGGQSIVAILDLKKNESKNSYEIYYNNGKELFNENAINFILRLEELGIGELLINSIDKDGTLEGYDFEFIEKIYRKIKIPITLLGGGNSYDNIKELFSKYGLVGSAIGSFFVFKGKYRAVLINYPSKQDKNNILDNEINATFE